MDRRVQPRVVRLEELLPFLQGHEKPALVSDVIRGEDKVHAAPGRLQDTGEELRVKCGDALHDAMHEVFLRHDIHQHLLEAAHVPRCLEDVAVSHHDALVRAAEGSVDHAGQPVVVEPVRVGPAVRIQVRHVAARRQGVVDDLVVASRSVAYVPAAHAPDVHVLRQGRARVAGAHFHDIHDRIQVLPHRHSPFGAQEVGKSFQRRRIDS